MTQHVYLDDIIVYSRTFQEHLRHIDVIVSRIKDAGLKPQPKKCQIIQTEVAYLGHIMFDYGVKTNPEKIRKVKDWPVPTSV